jgi:hypothetical protein
MIFWLIDDRLDNTLQVSSTKKMVASLFIFFAMANTVLSSE